MAINYKPSDVARKLGVTLDHVYKQLRAGRVEGATKIRGQWAIPAQTIRLRLDRKARAEGADRA